MRPILANLLTVAHPDEDLRRRGRNVIMLAFGMSFLGLILIMLWIVQGEYPSLVAGVLSLFVFAGSIVLARRGLAMPAGLLIIGMLTLDVLGIMIANNALSDTPFFLIIPVSIAGLVLSSRQVWPVFVACVLGLGGVTALITRGAPLGYQDFQILQDSVALLAILALISFLGAGSASRALRAAQVAREQAEAAAAERDRAAAELELRVAERTSELAGALAAQRAQAAELQASLEQQRTLNELLNTLALPIIPVRVDVLVAPLVGNLDPERAQKLIGDVLVEIERRRARAIILDVTGVAMVDTHLAQTLIRMAEATRLLGAKAMLVGIRPEVAQTLVSLGADLTSLHTAATLQEGLAAVRRAKS